MPRVKVLVFDAIKAAGDIGITTRQLTYAIYGNKVKRSPATIRNHIWQINRLLLATDVQIACHDRRHWLLTKSPPAPTRRQGSTATYKSA